MHPSIRKSQLQRHIEDVSNKRLSVESFFDILFGKKKDTPPPAIKETKTIQELIEKIKGSEVCSVHTVCDSFDHYYDSLNDLETMLLDAIDKNIKRVTSWLTFFISNKHNVAKNYDKIIQLGKYDYKVSTIKGMRFFKSKHYISAIYNTNNWDGIEDESNNVDAIDVMPKELQFVLHFEDMDFFLLNTENKEHNTITLDDSHKEKLIGILEKLEHKLASLAPEADKLRDLFYEAEGVFCKLAEQAGVSDVIYNHDYIGFGGSTHQGLGYLYEVRMGFAKDIIKEIKIK